MANDFEARPRVALAHPCASARNVAPLARVARRIFHALNGPARAIAPRPFADDAEAAISACWILHAR